MLLLFVISKFILTVRVEFSIVLGDVFNFRWLIDEASVGLATQFSWVEFKPGSFSVNDVLMVEILVRSQEVLDVA